PSTSSSSTASRRSLQFRTVAGFDRVNRIVERLLQDSLANGLEYQGEHPALEVLGLAVDSHVNGCWAVGLSCKGVYVPRGVSPHVGVSRRQHDLFGVGPVVMQALPDAVRAFGDVRVKAAVAMDLQIFVGAIVEQLRAAGPEVCESGDELFGLQSSCALE